MLYSVYEVLRSWVFLFNREFLGPANVRGAKDLSGFTLKVENGGGPVR